MSCRLQATSFWVEPHQTRLLRSSVPGHEGLRRVETFRPVPWLGMPPCAAGRWRACKGERAAMIAGYLGSSDHSMTH
jgi:hypothetical protein